MQMYIFLSQILSRASMLYQNRFTSLHNESTGSVQFKIYNNRRDWLWTSQGLPTHCYGTDVSQSWPFLAVEHRLFSSRIKTMKHLVIDCVWKLKVLLQKTLNSCLNLWSWYYLLRKIKFAKQVINSTPSSAAYMRQWIASASVHIMACRLFGTKPSSKPIVVYFQLHKS